MADETHPIETPTPPKKVVIGSTIVTKLGKGTVIALLPGDKVRVKYRGSTYGIHPLKQIST